MLRNLVTELIGMVLATTPGAAPSTGTADAGLIDDLVAANRILADQGVLDGFGHVSARDDKDPTCFLLARSMAPPLVTAADLMEFDLDGNPVDARGRTAYLERFIHSEIYKAHPEVRACAQPLAGSGTIRRRRRSAAADISSWRISRHRGARV